MGENLSAVISTPLPGAPRLGFITEGGALGRVTFLPPDATVRRPANAVAAYFAEQMERYFDGERPLLDAPLEPASTGFARRVRLALARIPPGSVITYGRLAREIGSGARAVAGACRANPLPLVVPCHRVVAAGGLGGYMGHTAGHAPAIKEWLLQHERAGRSR